MEDWVDRYGVKHRGLIDREESKEYSHQFPNAINKLKLVAPKRHRTEMFDDFIELLNLGLIEFTEDYDMKDYIMIPEENDKEKIVTKDEITGEEQTINGLTYKKYNLNWEEKLALSNIDLAKEELIAQMRYGGESGQSYRYGLSPDKKHKLHDDRCYVCCMLAYHLKLLRQGEIRNKVVEKKDMSCLLQFKQPTMGKNRFR